VLYGFTKRKRWDQPFDEVTLDKAGSVYGTAQGGAYGDACFQAVAALHSGRCVDAECPSRLQRRAHDGNSPTGKLAVRQFGQPFWATVAAESQPTSCFFGCGTIFKLVPPSASGGSWTERLIHKFRIWGRWHVAKRGASNGFFRHALWNYSARRSQLRLLNSNGCGAVYKLHTGHRPRGTWNESLMYSFGETIRRTIPNGGLLLDSSRNVYGTLSMVE